MPDNKYRGEEGSTDGEDSTTRIETSEDLNDTELSGATSASDSGSEATAHSLVILHHSSLTKKKSQRKKAQIGFRFPDPSLKDDKDYLKSCTAQLTISVQGWRILNNCKNR